MVQLITHNTKAFIRSKQEEWTGHVREIMVLGNG